MSEPIGDIDVRQCLVRAAILARMAELDSAEALEELIARYDAA